jgi:hypothetical protein
MLKNKGSALLIMKMQSPYQNLKKKKNKTIKETSYDVEKPK